MYRYSNQQNNNLNSFKQLTSSEDDVEMKKHDVILNESEATMLRYLVDISRAMSSEEIDIGGIKNVIDAIELSKKVQTHEYLDTLLHPERTRNSKIPSTMPIPTSSFQLKQSISITTNALGNAAIAINPFYLGSTNVDSTIYVNNNVGLTGQSASNFFLAVNAGQTAIPANVYNQYRLVSGSVTCKYVGRLDGVRGLIGGAIAFDQTATPTAFGFAATSLAKYGDFNTTQDAFFQQENFSLHGIRELYFPLDNNYEEYKSMNTSLPGFLFLIYILNAPPSETCFKLDVVLNMECLPDLAFLNYIPTSISSASVESKPTAVNTVKSMALMPESDYSYRKTPGTTTSGHKMINDNFLDAIQSGLGKLVSTGASFISKNTLWDMLGNVPYLGKVVKGVRTVGGTLGNIGNSIGNVAGSIGHMFDHTPTPPGGR
jgi:hypothetical protein